MNQIREKKHRLERSLYLGEITVAFTMNIKNKEKVLNNDIIFTEFEKILLKEIVTSPFMGEPTYDIHVYLFMPDHVHLIIQGKNKNSDVIKIINMFKQKTGFWFYKNMKNIIWQKDYYDHVIRNEKDLGQQINYILYNPVRSGLVINWKEYRFKGSTVHNFDEFES